MAEPTLGPVRITADLAAEVEVVDDGGEPKVRVDWAVTPESDTEPVRASRAWRSAGGLVDAGTTVETPELRSGWYLWIRASGRDAEGERTSDFTAPVLQAIPDTPRLSAVRMHVDAGGAVAVWRAEGSTETVSVRWAVHDPDASPDWSTAEEVDASDGWFAVPQRPAMDERASVELTPQDSGIITTTTGDTVVTTSGDLVTVSEARQGRTTIAAANRPADFGTVMEPRHWVFTTGGHPVRDSERNIVHSSGLAMDEDWVTTTDGLPVRASNFDLITRADG